MSDRVTKILNSGPGNPTAFLGPGALNQVDTLLGSLDDAPDIPDLNGIRPECWPPSNYPTYVFKLDPGRLAYVAGPIVQLRNRRLWDPEHALTRLAERVLHDPAPLPSLNTCRECASEDLGDQWTCGCDPLVVQPWNHTATLANNNCYSYAFRKLWCDSWGSTPGDVEPSSLEHLKQLIVDDGWDEVPKSALSPTSGHFIALMIGMQEATNFHFVRLDGHRWTHKVSYLVASACDAAGRQIPWDTLESADFSPWWRFHTYYRLRPGATLDHCLP